MNGSVLVVGASGNVGGAIVRHLAGRTGPPVRAAVRDPSRAKMRGRNAVAVRFDYDDPRTWGAALQGVEAVFLMVPPFDVRADTRVGAFVDAARKAGVQRAVLMTAQGVEAAEDAPLRKAERRVEASGIPHTFLRPNWFMQNFSHGFARPTIRAEGVFRLPAADARLGFIDAEDIAAVAVLALTTDRHVRRAYPLTGPEALTHDEVARAIAEVAGREVRYAAVEDDAFRAALRKAGWDEARVEYLATLMVGVRAGWASHLTTDVETLLGRRPTRFAEFAKREAKAWTA